MCYVRVDSIFSTLLPKRQISGQALCKIFFLRILYLTHLDKAVVFLVSVSHCVLLRGMPKSCSHLCRIEDRLSKDAVVNNSYNLDTVLLPDAVSLSFLSRSKSCTMGSFEISNPKMYFNYRYAKKSPSLKSYWVFKTLKGTIKPYITIWPTWFIPLCCHYLFVNVFPPAFNTGLLHIGHDGKYAPLKGRHFCIIFTTSQEHFMRGLTIFKLVLG